MSLQSNFPEEIPEGTRLVGDVILSEDDVCYYLAKHINEILREEDFREFYSHTGRGGIHPIILSIVTVLQYMEKYPDRRGSAQAVKRIDWKYAMHQELTWKGFHYSDLCNFRKRLLEHGAESLIFEKVIEHLRDKGWLQDKGRQRTDATHIIGQVQRLSVFELKWESLRMAVVDLISKDARWVLSQLDEDLLDKYSVSRNSYHLSETKLKQLETALEQDMVTVLNKIDQEGEQEWLQMTYVQLLHRVAREQLDCVDPQEFPDWDEVLALDLPEGLVQSPHEPEARYGKKRSKDWQGYKTHITETVSEEGQNFITDVHVTPANVSDSTALTDIQDNLAQRDLSPEQHYVDQGYMSSENIDTSAEQGIDLRGRVAPHSSSKPEGFRLCDFEIDIEQEQAHCPAGKTSVRWTHPSNTTGVDHRASFGKQCRDCPFFREDACTTNPRGRYLDINAHHDTLQRRRQEQQTEDFKQDMKHRAAIEGTISEAVRGHGLRHNRYRGVAKTQLQTYFTATAINLKRLMDVFTT